MFDEQRQMAGVMEMGIGQNNGSDAARIDRKFRPVPQPKGLKRSGLEQGTSGAVRDAVRCQNDIHAKVASRWTNRQAASLHLKSRPVRDLACSPLAPLSLAAADTSRDPHSW